MRTRIQLKLGLSSDAFEHRDLGNMDVDIVGDDFGEGGVQKIRVAASATNLSVMHQSVASGKFVAIRTYTVDPTQVATPLTVRLNSPSGEPITINPVGTTKQGFFMLSAEGLTGVYLSNPSSTVAMWAVVSTVGD